jgi:PAS domain S-box-containing protein
MPTDSSLDSLDSLTSSWSESRRLALTIEELAVAQDELRSQNEALESTRHVLAAERERYRELFHHAPVAYLVTDAMGVIREANRAASLLLHANIDALVGKPLVVFTQTASRRRLRAAINAMRNDMRKDSAMATVSVRVLPRRGPPTRVEATLASAPCGRDGTSEIRWLLADQTQRVRRDRSRKRRAAALERLIAERTIELEHARQQKDRLLAAVSHEFRTALAAVGGYAELLELGIHGILNEEQLNDVRRIRTAYDHLNGVVGDLLDYSRVAGTPAVELEEFLLFDAMQSIAALVRPDATKKGLSLSLPDTDGATIVRADPERFRQILLNLLGNAIKFTPTGGHIAVAWRRTGDDAIVEVRDDGPGIPPGNEESIFQPFVRLEGSEKTPGTGLGLTISRELARAMQGELSVRTVDGGGSCFALRLPVSTDRPASARHD